MSKNVPLKPCPFCGGEAVKKYLPGFNHYTVGCTECFVRFTRKSVHQAIECWNTRVQA